MSIVSKKKKKHETLVITNMDDKQDCSKKISFVKSFCYTLYTCQLSGFLDVLKKNPTIVMFYSVVWDF